MLPANFLTYLLPAAMLISLRIGAMMSLAPFFGGEGMPMLSKAAFTMVLTVILLPLHQPALIPATLGGWLQAASGELILGLVMALALQFVFEAAHLAGQVMGFQMGYSLVNIMDPQSQVDTPVLSVFTYTLTMLIFLQLNGHHWILRGLAHSYDVVAPGQVMVTLATTTALLHGAAGIWTSAVEIAAPVLAATLMLDVLLSLLAKASPQMPVLMVSLALKSVVGFCMLWTVMGRWPRLFEHYFEVALHLCERLLLAMR
jgi:flagellar biosynthetic protein FliR